MLDLQQASSMLPSAVGQCVAAPSLRPTDLVEYREQTIDNAESCLISIRNANLSRSSEHGAYRVLTVCSQ